MQRWLVLVGMLGALRGLASDAHADSGLGVVGGSADARVRKITGAAGGPQRLAAAAPYAPKQRPILVLESHVGPRPAEIGRVMNKLDDLLETYGFAARPSTIEKLAGVAIPRPGVLDPDLTPAVIAQRLNDGWAMFVAARWDEAVTALTQALDAVHRNPALVVSDTSHLDLTFKAYVALAVSLQRKADAGNAARAMIEVIRIFTSRPVARTEAWGREGEKLYSDIYKQVAVMGRGQLSIAGGNPEAAIFVEGQLRGMGNANLGDLVPGIYRVFVRLPGSLGRQYQVQVYANEDAYLNVDPEIDTSLWATESWIGFQFSSEAARKREGRYAVKIARQWMDSGAVIVLAAGREQGRLTLEGTRYRDGLELRRGRIYLDTAGAAVLGVLAQFLLDGRAGPGLEVLKADARVTRTSPQRARIHVPQVVLSTGALALAGSTTWYLVSPDDDHVQSTYTDHKFPAVLAFTGGAALAGAGLYLYLRRARAAGRLPASMLSTGVAAAVAGVIWYAADEEPYAGPGKIRPTYRETAAWGLVMGGVGVAMASAGGWLLARERRRPALPTAVISAGGGAIGWAGRF